MFNQWQLGRTDIPIGTGTYIARFNWAITFNDNLYGIAKFVSIPTLVVQQDGTLSSHGVFLKQDPSRVEHTSISAIAIGH